jgi:hypothetical protein
LSSRERTYGVVDRERGMLALVLAGGNGREASRNLAEAGHHIPERTLYDWRKRYTQRYAELAEQEAPKIRARVSADMDTVLAKKVQIASELADKQREEIPNLEGKDLFKAGYQNMIEGGVLFDKIQDAREAPLRPSQPRPVEEIVQSMKRQGYDVVIEGMAEDVTDSDGQGNGRGASGHADSQTQTRELSR